MNKIAKYIDNRLKLRKPQAESLEILENLTNKISLGKKLDLAVESNKVKKEYPIFKEFERDFPSLCFSLATGVGKTRLMGAFIAYLYMEKGIKNFFVLAPNLTIYNKLIKDFSDNNSSKYVFKGISDFVHNPPRIIHGDNYEQFRQATVGNLDVTINVFNISKINSETRGGKEPKMKRLSEYLGESYFQYLVNLPDLVLLMDESHHYRATRGMDVINELNPILGLELTATPRIEKGKKSIKFQNVVYEYSLARAITDGYVKEPAVATRRNFDAEQYKNNQDELDKIKLKDAVKVHIETQAELEKYARDNKTKIVKPFILVVAKDTNHASKIKDYISSNEFYKGYYSDKVMEIHSNQKGAEKDENVANLLNLESHDNKIEIVIHVNMLKEGWDVTNLYTIVPLRASASVTLTEQTIGRGLRLPYGKRTNDEKVDRLTIISHDHYEKIVKQANDPESIIRKNYYIDNDSDDDKRKEVIKTLPKHEEEIFNEDKDKGFSVYEVNGVKINISQNIIKEVKKETYKVIMDLNKHVKNIDDIKEESIEKIAVSNIKQLMTNKGTEGLEKQKINHLIKDVYQKMANSIVMNTIPIPRVTIQQTVIVKWGFKDFDLDTKNLNYQPPDKAIKIKGLKSNKVDIINFETHESEETNLENIIVCSLLDYPEIDYDKFSVLIYKLAKQAIKKFQSYLNEDNVIKVVKSRRLDIADFIYSQMKEKLYYEVPKFEVSEVRPFTKIEANNLTRYIGENEYNFRDTIEPKSDVPKKIFGGFKKACHTLNKFDSNTEKEFAILLEDDDEVIKWIRPSKKQFNIYWDRYREKRYEPDFVVETARKIYMIETKSEKEITSEEVQLKAQASIKYCNQVTEYNLNNNGKKWNYLLVPHNEVKDGMTFKYYVERFRYTKE